MIQGKTKFNPFNKMDRKLKYDAFQLIKVFDKESKSFIFNVSDIKILRKDGRLTIYLVEKNKDKVIFDLCMKHTLISRATDVSTPKIDSCRIIGDPSGYEILLNFKNPSIANEYELKLTECMETFNALYANISFTVKVSNLVMNKLKESASVCISGLTQGKDLKSWIEKEFQFPEIHLPCYVLQIVIRNKLLTVQDNVSIFRVYEHFKYCTVRGHCSSECFLSSKTPMSPICIQIDFYKNTTQCKKDEISYSIEEKWGVGEMPKWLTRLMSDLYYYGPEYEGVFRVNGKDIAMPKWYKRMLDCDDFIISEDIFNKATIFKYFLRNIKGSLMTKHTKKQFNDLCKKFVKISTEEFLASSKKKSKLIKLVKSLPKTHLFLFQHILIVLNAIVDSPKTQMKPFSMATSISPSIFPLININYWSISHKILEAIILLTDEIVRPIDKERILSSFSMVKLDSDNFKGFAVQKMADNNNNSSREFDSMTLSSLTDDNNKLQNFNSNEKLYESESDNSIEEDSNLSEIVSSSDIESDSSRNSIVYSPDGNIQNFCYANSENLNDSEIELKINNYNDVNSKCEVSKNISMEIESEKEIYPTFGGRTIDSEVAVNENFSTILNEKKNKGQRHKSFVRLASSTKQLDRHASIDIISSEFLKSRNKNFIDSCKSPSVDIPVIRKHSRKALSVVVESNNNISDNNSHRSRSPYVKKLVKMYESRTKIMSAESPSISKPMDALSIKLIYKTQNQ